jgi:hypothetical protein
MSLSPFFISALFLCVPYTNAAFQDLKGRTVNLVTWKWVLLAVPSSLIGWILWIQTNTFDPRIFLLLAGFIAVFFIAGLLWKTGHPSIGGGDILGICLMLLFVPVLPELGPTIIYIFPLCLCTLIISLYWNTRGEEVPFLFPFAICHAGLLISSMFI